MPKKTYNKIRKSNLPFVYGIIYGKNDTMHEYPITEQIIKIAGEHCRKAGGSKVTKVSLVIGDYSASLRDDQVLREPSSWLFRRLFFLHHLCPPGQIRGLPQQGEHSEGSLFSSPAVLIM